MLTQFLEKLHHQNSHFLQDNYCFVYSTASFDPQKQLVSLLRGNDDYGDDASPGRCGFSGLPLAAGKTYTLVVTLYSRAGEGSWDAEVVSGPGGFVIAQQQQQQPQSASEAASAPAAPAAVAAAAAAAPAVAPAAAVVAPAAALASAAASPAAPPPSLATAAAGGSVSSQRWDWVAAESVSSGEEDEKAELAAMFAEEAEVEREKKEKPFEEEDH